MAVVTGLDTPVSPAPRRVTIALVVLQLWVVVAYLVMGPVPYFWPDAAYPSLIEHGVPEALLVLPGVLLAMPGFWIVVFGVAVGAILAGAGAGTLAVNRRVVSTRLATWLVVATLLNVALLVFSLTPLGTDVRIWVLD